MQELEYYKAATREASSGRGLAPAISLDNLLEPGVAQPESLVSPGTLQRLASPFESLQQEPLRSSVEAPESPSHRRVS